MSHPHSRDIIHRDIKPANVLVSNFHYKSYKHKNLEMVFGKKSIACKLLLLLLVVVLLLLLLLSLFQVGAK